HTADWARAQIGARCAEWLADPSCRRSTPDTHVRHYSDSSRLQVGLQNPAVRLNQPYLLSITSARALGPESGPTAGSERLEAHDANQLRRPTNRLNGDSAPAQRSPNCREPATTQPRRLPA